MSDVPNITLNDGNAIPQLGFGTFQIKPEDAVEAVSRALEIGYRHIDTAQMYGNEAEVGEAIRNSGIDRGEIFVTSKLNNSFHEPDDARESFEKTLSDLGLDYVDLFLIHWPLPTAVQWRLRIHLADDGRVQKQRQIQVHRRVELSTGPSRQAGRRDRHGTGD